MEGVGVQGPRSCQGGLSSVALALGSIKNFKLKLSTFHSPQPYCIRQKMKRKSEAPGNGKAKKRAISDEEAHQNFRKGLFDSGVLEDYTNYYAASQP